MTAFAERPFQMQTGHEILTIFHSRIQCF